MRSDLIRKAFQMPKPVKIMGRTSIVTNSFVNGIIPVLYPTDAEILEALALLGMAPTTVVCAYCGDGSTEWDHLRPIVRARRPTGYISEIRNLVPACGKCNQSKGNRPWLEWMLGPAQRSPRSRSIADLSERVERLKAFETWGRVVPIDFENILGSEDWNQHWENLDKIEAMMRVAQGHADKLRAQLSPGA